MVGNVSLNSFNRYDITTSSKTKECKNVTNPVSDKSSLSSADAASDSLGRAIVNGCKVYNIGSEFKPATSFKELKKQLENYKNPKGEKVFNSEEIEDILNAENDIKEISLILNNLQMRKSDFKGYQIKSILETEGITNDEVNHSFELLDAINSSANINLIKDKQFTDFDILKKGKELKYVKIEDIDRNLGLISSINKITSDYTKHFGFYDLKNLLLTNLTSQSIEKLSSLSDKIMLKQFEISSTILNKTDEEINTKINLLNNIDSEPRLANALKDEEFKKTFLTDILKKEFPDNFSLTNASEMIDLLNYSQNDKQISKLFEDKFNKADCMIAILTKQGTTFDEGKKYLTLLSDLMDEANIPSSYVPGCIQHANFNKSIDSVNQIKTYKEMEPNAKSELIRHFLSENIDDEAADRIFYFMDKYNKLGRIGDFNIRFCPSLPSTEDVEESQKKGCNILKDFYPKEKVDKLFDELNDIKSKLSPENWDYLAEKMSYDIHSGKIQKLNIDSEILKYIDEMEKWAKQNNEDIELKSDLYTILQKSYDVNALRKNKESFIKLIQLQKTAGKQKVWEQHNQIGIYPQSLLTYEGDLEKIYQTVKDIYTKYSNQETNFSSNIYINDDSVVINYEYYNPNEVDGVFKQSKAEKIYSKNADKLLTETLQSYEEQNNIETETTTEKIYSENTGKLLSECISSSKKQNNIETETTTEKIYSENTGKLSQEMILYTEENNGKSERILTIKDYEVNQENKISYRKMSLPGCSGEYIPSEIITTQKDEKGNIIKITKTKESSVPGVYDICEIYPNGEIKILSSALEDDNGLTIQKDLPSFDGTQTQVRYNKKNNGAEEYSYKVIDKNGEILTSQNRTTEIVDENTYINNINGKKYKVAYSDSKIEIFDYDKKESKTIDLKTLNPENNKELLNILRTMSGDELWKLGENIKSITVVNRIESAIDPDTGELNCGPHKFVIEHELGHGKDRLMVSVEELQNMLEGCSDEELYGASNDYRKINSDENLRKIYLEEREELLKNLNPAITNEADYFISRDNHYAGEWGGLGEVIAETNALKTTERFHPFLAMRSHLLQQYMPRTVAYLMTNHL